MIVNTARGGGKALRVGVTLGMTVAAVVGFASTSQAATTTTTSQPSVTLGSTSGPSAGGNVVTVTAPSAKFSVVKQVTSVSGTNNYYFPTVYFQLASSSSATCATTLPTSYSPPASAQLGGEDAAQTTAPTSYSGVQYISPTKLAITIPTGLSSEITTTTLSATYLACVYNKPGNLIGKASYTIAAAPTFTAITPSAGPVTGGQTVTVTGDNFFSGLTASINGVPLTNITVIDQDTFTGVTGPEAAGSYPITITSSGGSLTPTSTSYKYESSLVVTPNTAPSGSTVTLDVQGIGFNSQTFDTPTTTSPAPDDTNAHIYLVNGTYGVGTVYAASSTTKAATSGKALESNDCESVTVISDTELTCTLNLGEQYVAGTASGAAPATLGGSAQANGAYIVTFVSNGDLLTTGNSAATTSGVASSAAFTVSDY